MPEPANTPPPSPADFNTLARGLATGEPARTETAACQAASRQRRRRRQPRRRRMPSRTRPRRTMLRPSRRCRPRLRPCRLQPSRRKPASNIAAADQPIAEKIKDALTARASRIFDRKDERTAAETFYKERGYAPLWIENGAVSTRAKARRRAAEGRRRRRPDRFGLSGAGFRCGHDARCARRSRSEADRKRARLCAARAGRPHALLARQRRHCLSGAQSGAGRRAGEHGEGEGRCSGARQLQSAAQGLQGPEGQARRAARHVGDGASRRSRKARRSNSSRTRRTPRSLCR